MRTAPGHVAALVFVLCLGAFVEAAHAQTSWYNSSWSYRKTITINYTNVSANLTNFPVLISRTDSDLQARAQTNGYDLLFTSSDGTNKLAHEIETYTSSNGTLVAWVKVPILSSTTNTTLLPILRQLLWPATSRTPPTSGTPITSVSGT